MKDSDQQGHKHIYRDRQDVRIAVIMSNSKYWTGSTWAHKRFQAKEYLLPNQAQEARQDASDLRGTIVYG